MGARAARRARASSCCALRASARRAARAAAVEPADRPLDLDVPVLAEAWTEKKMSSDLQRDQEA